MPADERAIELQKKVSEIGVVPMIKLNNLQRDAGPLSDALCAGGVLVAEITDLCRKSVEFVKKTFLTN